jgi:hypothetical protein
VRVYERIKAMEQFQHLTMNFDIAPRHVLAQFKDGTAEASNGVLFDPGRSPPSVPQYVWLDEVREGVDGSNRSRGREHSAAADHPFEGTRAHAVPTGQHVPSCHWRVLVVVVAAAVIHCGAVIH